MRKIEKLVICMHVVKYIAIVFNCNGILIFEVIIVQLYLSTWGKNLFALMLCTSTIRIIVLITIKVPCKTFLSQQKRSYNYQLLASTIMALSKLVQLFSSILTSHLKIVMLYGHRDVKALGVKCNNYLNGCHW